ncbi:unnamed protein product [Closterium sp. NIES-54]
MFAGEAAPAAAAAAAPRPALLVHGALWGLPSACPCCIRAEAYLCLAAFPHDCVECPAQITSCDLPALEDYPSAPAHPPAAPDQPSSSSASAPDSSVGAPSSPPPADPADSQTSASADTADSADPPAGSSAAPRARRSSPRPVIALSSASASAVEDYLRAHRGVDLDAALSPVERAELTALRGLVETTLSAAAQAELWGEERNRAALREMFDSAVPWPLSRALLWREARNQGWGEAERKAQQGESGGDGRSSGAGAALARAGVRSREEAPPCPLSCLPSDPLVTFSYLPSSTLPALPVAQPTSCLALMLPLVPSPFPPSPPQADKSRRCPLCTSNLRHTGSTGTCPQSCMLTCTVSQVRCSSFVRVDWSFVPLTWTWNPTPSSFASTLPSIPYPPQSPSHPSPTPSSPPSFSPSTTIPLLFPPIHPSLFGVNLKLALPSPSLQVQSQLQQLVPSHVPLPVRSQLQQLVLSHAPLRSFLSAMTNRLTAARVALQDGSAVSPPLSRPFAPSRGTAGRKDSRSAQSSTESSKPRSTAWLFVLAQVAAILGYIVVSSVSLELGEDDDEEEEVEETERSERGGLRGQGVREGDGGAEGGDGEEDGDIDDDDDDE